MSNCCRFHIVMSNHGLQSSDDRFAKSMESRHRNQSIWMDHWTTTSCHPKLQVQNKLPLLDESRGKYIDREEGERDVQIAEPSTKNGFDMNATPCNISEYRNSWICQQDDKVVASNVPESAKAVEVVTKAKRVEITYETVATNSRNSRLESQPVSVFKFSEKIGSILAQKRLAVSIEHESITETDAKHGNTTESYNFQFPSNELRSSPTETAFQLKEYHSQPEISLQCQKQLAKSFSSLDKSNSPLLSLFQDKHAGSNSNPMPYLLKSRRVRSSMFRKEETDQSSSQAASIECIKRPNTTHVEHENSNYLNYSSALVCDKQMNNFHLGSQISEGSYLGKEDGSLQLNNPSPSNLCVPVSNGELGNTVHDYSSTKVLPCHSFPGDSRRLEEFNKLCHSSSDELKPVHQFNELRLLNSICSVNGLSRSPKLSQTTNHLSIRDMSKGNHISRVSNTSTNLKESASHGLFTLLPHFDCQDECSDKLQPLGNNINGEAKKNEMTASLSTKNDSSAETDTMDINLCQTWNSHPSITSSPSYKDIMVGKNPEISQSKIVRAQLRSRTQVELPDINQEPPSCLAAEQECAKMEYSMSRTESLDVEHLLHFDQAGNSNSSSDPSSRWVKRLRLSSSGCYAHGTKNMKIGDPSCTAKFVKFDKRTDCNLTSLKPNLSELFGKQVEPMELDKTLLPSENKELAMKECLVLNLSHPWIQRWLHNREPRQEIKSVAPVTCELENSKMSLDEYQTKQFPSIAAMALMGKTMNGLQACKFQNKGSFVVWGTEGF